MFFARLALTILGFIAASVYGVWIAVIRRDRSLVAHDYAQMLVRLTRPALGITTEVMGREHLTAHQPSIFLANHQSIYDVPILAELYPPHTVVIGKKEVRRIPFFGWLYSITGNVLIDRADNTQAVGRLQEAEEAVRERGLSVWIFPEGTRATEPGQLLPFKKGAFYMAVATGAALVPIVVEPIQEFFDLRRLRIRPARIRVRVLEPILPAGQSEEEVPRLIALAQERMQEALEDLATERERNSNEFPD